MTDNNQYLYYDSLFTSDFSAIMNDPRQRLHFVQHFVQHFQLSDQQVSTYCGVSIRSWKDWFNERREIPKNIAELFAFKIHCLYNHKSSEIPGLCVIVTETHPHIAQMPLAIIKRDRFLSIEIDKNDENYAFFSSMEVNFQNIPYKRIVRFHLPSNHHVERWCNSYGLKFST